MLFAGGLPQTFKEAYPFRPLVVRAGTDGNLKEMQISRFTVDLPGAFSLKGGGILENLTDSLRRSGTIGLDMVTQNLNFLTGLTGVTPDGSLVVPDSMSLKMKMEMNGPQYKAKLDLKEGKGSMNVNAALNSLTEVYTADLKITCSFIISFRKTQSMNCLFRQMPLVEDWMLCLSILLPS